MRVSNRLVLTVVVAGLLGGCSCDGDPPVEGELRDAAPIARRDAGGLGGFEDPSGAPPIVPELLALTYAGAGGDQYIREVGFTAEGRVVGEGTGFRVERHGGDQDGMLAIVRLY